MPTLTINSQDYYLDSTTTLTNLLWCLLMDCFGARIFMTIKWRIIKTTIVAFGLTFGDKAIGGHQTSYDMDRLPMMPLP